MTENALLARTGESSTPAPAKTISPMRAGVLTTGVCLLIWFWRRPEQLFHPYLWADEANILARFMSDGWFGLLHPYNGNYCWPTTLLLGIAASLSFANLTVISSWLATAVFALTIWML